MKEILDGIASAQARLDDIDSQLGCALGSIEHALRQRISTRIETAISDDKIARVAFGKHDGTWQLLAEIGGKWHPVAGINRDLRARVLSGGHLRKLIAEAAQFITSQIEGRKAATNEASELLHLLHNGD